MNASTLTLDQQAQERALLAAILAEPGEDAHRLIYADFLEKYGDLNRAEFIRVQIELATLEVPFTEPDGRGFSGPPGPVEYEAQGVFYSSKSAARGVLRSENLQGRFGQQWACGMPWDVVLSRVDEEYHTGRPWFFSRGFIHTVRCSLAAWEQHGPALVARHPVERVEITDKNPVYYVDESCWRYDFLGSGWMVAMRYRLGRHTAEQVARNTLSVIGLAWAMEEAVRRGLMP